MFDIEDFTKTFLVYTRLRNILEKLVQLKEDNSYRAFLLN